MAAIEDRRSHAGEELERLYEEHGERVRAICLGLLRDRYEAEDAAQQVFLSALRSLHKGTVPRDAEAWLATICRHECWARSRRPSMAPLHAGLHDVKAVDPSTSALSRAELEETWRTVAALPGRQREVLLLREVRGLGYDELAADLQLSRPSVRSLLTRARRTLRAQLERGAAVLTGGPWLNTFARLFGDGSNPAFSSVTKTAAVGLGAVAITGGAVLAPHLVRHGHRASARASHARVSHRPSSVGVATEDRVRTDDIVRTEETHRGKGSGGGGSDDLARHDGRGRDGGGTIDSSGGSASGSSGSSGHDGGGSETSTSGGPGPDTSSGSGSGSGSHDSSEGPSPTVTSVSSSDGGGGSSGGDGSGSSTDSGSSSGSGGSDGGGSSGSDGGH